VSEPHRGFIVARLCGGAVLFLRTTRLTSVIGRDDILFDGPSLETILNAFAIETLERCKGLTQQ